MKAQLKYSILLGVVLVMTRCDVPIELDPEQTPSIPVIEGVLTDREGMNYVRITETVPFYFVGENPVRSDAIVQLTEDNRTTVSLSHYTGTNTDSMGYYFPPQGYKGVIGSTYTLEVTLGQETYTAIETMLPVTRIDSLQVSLDVLESLDPVDEGRFYEVLVFAREPQETKDFYLFKFYRNDEPERAFESDIYIVDDIFLSVNLKGVPVPFYFAEGDTAVVEMYAITSSAFTYYSDLQIALSNDGGLFSPPPSNPRTNFDKNTPGYFLVAPVESQSIIIE